MQPGGCPRVRLRHCMPDVPGEGFRDIIIVGGGLSGSLVAANLLRRARTPLRVTLVEKKPPLGRGVAYGTQSLVHRLNVPAAKLSAWPEEPDHFFDWAKQHLPLLVPTESAVEKSDFLPRYVYGHYVEFVLNQAIAKATSDVIFKSAAGEVVDIDEGQGDQPHTVLLSDGTTLPAHAVVLALGNLPGEYPIRRSLPIYRSWRYVHVPWLMAAVENIKPDDEVLIVGAGLTAVDIILQLDAQGHRGTIHALSRRGLRPRRHLLGPAYPAFLDKDALPSSLRAAVRRVRKEIAEAAGRGTDWRVVLDAIRPVTQAMWKSFTIEDRARFMRHVRPFWETHRHRLAPPVAERVKQMEEQGAVVFYAGRLQTLEERDGAVQAMFRCRDSGQSKTLRVGKVINCTGPRTDYSKFQHPLFINLLARGLIDHDPLALGINATPEGEVYRYRGEPSAWLFTLGAPMKGALWECTAVPEIRVQAAKLSELLTARGGVPAEG
jgi:uncharacterized NAD(P)/FAD-binding protein YdhS